MADLLSILSSAATSLAAHRATTATASHNIANANTPGYTRQRAELRALSPELLGGGSYLGRGAELGSVTQARDRFLEGQVPQALGGAARSTAESEALQAVHVLDPERAGSLAAAIGGFYGSLRALAQNPSESGLRSDAFASARSLAYTFNRASTELQAQRSGLDARLSGYVGEVNASARAVADANLAIARARASGGEPNDLLDQRRQHLDRLAELTGGIPVEQSDGMVNVQLPGGTPLVSGTRASAVSLLADPANGGLFGLRVAAADGAPPAGVPAGAFGGSIGGTLAARDGAMKTALGALDQLAADVAGELNVVHRNGRGLSDATSRSLFTGSTDPNEPEPDLTPITAASIRVKLTDPSQLATAAAGGAAGDARNANLLVDTERKALSGGQDVQATLAGITSAFGAEARRAEAFAEQDEGIRDQLLEMRESASGVSIDEELVEMQRAQRAFEALAKVIQVADEMTRTLIQIR
jgi:flagellar hook-associated protein 1 FlgK